MSNGSQPTTTARPQPVAVIDLGATALRLQVAEVGPGGTVRSLAALHQAVQLGKDVFTTGQIQPRSIEECVRILQSYRRVLAEYGIDRPEQIRAVATSAVREAENREAFLDRLYMATGINIEAIDGPEENRLTFVAVQDLFEQHPELKATDTLIVEIGGGSSELIFVRDGRVIGGGNYRLGSLRMREALELSHVPAARTREVLDQQIFRSVEQIQRSTPVRQVTYLVALSADARFAASLLHPHWETERLCRLPVSAFAELADRLVPMSVDELVRTYHLPYHEAETIGPALLAYVRLAEKFHVREIIVTSATLRDGLLREMALGGAWTLQFADQAVQSAMLLANRYNVDEMHAMRVADLSLRLFRELQPDHGLDDRYAVLLRIAALLHEVGRFINDRSHHKHSMYIIRNSDLFGLTQRDRTIVGLVARYHRRSTPRPYHTEYTMLDRDTRHVVVKLAALLRVADALDRKRTSPLRHIRFQRTADALIITVADPVDLTLEQSALREKSDLFEQVYGRRLELRSGSLAEGVVAGG